MTPYAKGAAGDSAKQPTIDDAFKRTIGRTHVHIIDQDASEQLRDLSSIAEDLPVVIGRPQVYEQPVRLQDPLRFTKGMHHTLAFHSSQ